MEGFTHQASVDAYNTIRSPRDWIDRAVGIKADVASLYWSGDQFRFWEAEIFNRSVGSVYSYPGPYDGLPGLVDVDVTRRGAVLQGDGSPVTVRYLLTDVDTKLGVPIAAAQPEAAMVLNQVDGPIVLRERVDGLFTDRWSGAQATYTRFACEGGAVVATLTSPAGVHRTPMPVTASGGAGAPQTVSVAPARSATIRTPLRPDDGLCQVVYTMPTVSPGPQEERVLGVKFGFRYEPP